MNVATVTEAKNGLSALLDRVKAGDEVVITEHGRPIARVVPILRGEAPEGRLARLERAGVVRRGGTQALDDLLAVLPPEPAAGMDVVALLLAERDSGW